MGLADDDDMLAEIRLAHTLQRVHGEARHPRLHAAEAFALVWNGGARVVGAERMIGRLEPGRRGDVITIDLNALRAPFSTGDADIWEILLARGKAVHVDSVIVDGRVLMRNRRHQQIDRAALTEELATAAKAAINRRSAAQHATIDQLTHQITHHYQAPAWNDRQA